MTPVSEPLGSNVGHPTGDDCLPALALRYSIEVVPLRRPSPLRLVPRRDDQQASRDVSDDDVLAAFDGGAPESAQLLYRHLVGVVEATLFRVIGRREHDFDDLVQSVFEQVLITLRRKRFARACSLRSWAASIACNIGLNALRSRGTDRKYFDRSEEFGARAGTLPSTDDPESATVQSHQLGQLRRCLAALSPEQAETLLLHDAFGYELAEIAVLTRASVAAAQSRLVRGRKALRRRLAEAGIGSEEAT